MDPWEMIEKAAKDPRSGSVGVTVTAAKGVRALTSRKDLSRAAKRLLRAHPVMAPLWRLMATAFAEQNVARAVDAYVGELQAGSAAAADIRWVIGRRARTVLTHSSSATVFDALLASKARIGTVLCAASLPGGEGRALARRLAAKGLDAQVIADAEVARSCSSVDVAIVGADAITEIAVVNKVGTMLVALAAREAGVPCYALAPTTKAIPNRFVAGGAERFEATPLDLFDAIITERGPKRGPAMRRLVQRVSIPAALEAIKT